MDLLNSLGFVNFWGVTPFMNLFETESEIIKNPKTKEVNVLISNSNDIHHFLYTIYKLFVSQREDKVTYPLINFYIHEDHRENLCRFLLFIHLLTDRTKSVIERVEMFMEIYGNTLLPSRTIDYINATYKQLINFICNDKRVNLVYQKLFNFSCLLHKEIDEMCEIFMSYDSKVPYDIEKYRNDRVRYALKDRYDYRKNMYDWDYNMNMQKFAPIVRLQYYMYWRENGIAFVMRLNQYKFPNRTMANYIEGRSKKTTDSCMVRGFWADIVNSPYISYGLSLETRDEITYFYANNKIQYTRDSQDVTEYNLVKFLLRLDHDEKYDFMQREKQKEKEREERRKREEEEREKKEKEEEDNKNNKKLEEIKEEEDKEEKEDDENEINTDSEETKKKRKEEEKKRKKEEKKRKEEEKKKKEEEKKENEENLKKKDKNYEIKKITEKAYSELALEDLKEINKTTEQTMIEASNESQYDPNELIQAFREVNFKIYFLSGDIEKSVYRKSKFKNKFDIVLYGFHASSKFNENQKQILKNTTRILFETNSHMTSFTDQQRKEFNKKLNEMCKKCGFILDDTTLKFMYQYKIDPNPKKEEEKKEDEISTTNTSMSNDNEKK